MKKRKVTKRAVVKTPWYERPPLLFGAIAVVLVAGGILMAHLTAGPSNKAAGDAEADSLVQVADLAPVAEPGLEHVLESGAPLPAARPGATLPAMEVETLREAVAARQQYREARSLRSADESAEGGLYAFTPVREVWSAAQAGGQASSWSELPLATEFRPWADLGIQRDKDGTMYVEAFVDGPVAQALGDLGPDLTLEPAPLDQGPPKWQFWRKRPKVERLKLYQDSEITLYPDLCPEAMCLVVLPLDRLRPVGIEAVRTGGKRPIEALRVALQ